jgi:NAD-dependent SIR2 family protein deacetylase
VSIAESAALNWALDHARQLIENRKLAVLTGAGISTESGIPDYRGGGKSPRNPITFQQFIASADIRARYWARSYFGWQQIASAQPNEGHQLLAEAEESGHLSTLVTQNVDGLHSRAGSHEVTELHGSLADVICLSCGDVTERLALTSRIEDLNPKAAFSAQFEIAPDGDAQIENVANFQVPSCLRCGGILKPRVVFFGETIPSEVTLRARSEVLASDALLVVGSSLAVNSALRLVQLAVNNKLPVVIVNIGETKADSICDVKLEAAASLCLRELLG